MEKGGEVVAIVPRSFCNGLYYRPFREWLLERVAIRHIHLFHSRTSAFREEDVLQENVILKLVRGAPQGDVTVSTSSDTGFSDVVEHSYSFGDIVHPGDTERFIHVPLSPEQGGIYGVPMASRSLKEIGLQVSTGPVVDFRLKGFLRKDSEKGTVPLLYATHFADGRLDWPKESKKPNALMRDKETEKWLYPNGYYTVVRRFSSKEEKRRVVACVVEPEKLTAEVIGFENHLNVFHAAKEGISPEIAYGLAAFLNSTAVDECFRRFSGHTQVNATDLRMLRYPDRNGLEKLGRWARKAGVASQDVIDAKLAELSGG
jgi:adenine-specific DNA-methyltransferase